MEWGLIYIKVVPTKGSPIEWIKYCYLTELLPQSMINNTETIANDINQKYSDDIVIPMDNMIHPGCTTTPQGVEIIAADMYNQFSEMMDRQGIPNSVRCVYSVGELSTVDVDSVHKLGNDEVMVKLGQFLDESDEPGLFKI